MNRAVLAAEDVLNKANFYKVCIPVRKILKQQTQIVCFQILSTTEKSKQGKGKRADYVFTSNLNLKAETAP